MRRHFFAYMSRMKHIKRWALMRNTWQEDIAQHSLQVSMIAHALALLRNRRFGGGADPERAALLALYHEAPEVITGDLATPIKYFNPGIRSAYKEIEGIAARKLHSMLPEDLQGDYAHLLLTPESDPEGPRVKPADKIAAYIKCVEELRAGNDEFARAGESILAQIEALDLPEARACLAAFLPSVRRPMDELSGGARRTNCAPRIVYSSVPGAAGRPLLRMVLHVFFFPFIPEIGGRS